MVRIPVEDGRNNYSLQDRELHTVTDLNGMVSTAAIFRANGQIDIDEDDQGRGYVEGGFEAGTTPSAHFIKVNGVNHPADFLSLSMSTAMYHFENIKAFYDGFEANGTMTFPREVWINLKIIAHKDHQTGQAVNNAEFVPSFDVFWINSFTDNTIPLSFNGGVLAHEYLHSIFNNILKEAAARHLKNGTISSKGFQDAHKLADSLDAVNEWQGKSKITWDRLDLGSGGEGLIPGLSKAAGDNIKLANGFLFASVNEGIADFFGYEYTKNESWIVASIPSQTNRVLNTSKQFLAASDVQQMRFVEAAKATDPSLRLDVHDIGSYYSHFLWTVANDPSWGHEAARRATLEFMKNYGDFLTVSKDKKYLSLGDLVRLFFKNRAPGPDLCQAVMKQFPMELGPGQLGVPRYDCGMSDPTVVGP